MSYFVGVDFDGTCVMHDFPYVGREVPGAVEVLKWYLDNGAKLVLNTMRCNSYEQKYLDDAIKWFEDRGIPLYGANENPSQKHWTGSPKVYAHVYIDDMAAGVPLKVDYTVSPRPFVDWYAVREWQQKKGFPIEKITKPNNNDSRRTQSKDELQPLCDGCGCDPETKAC